MKKIVVSILMVMLSFILVWATFSFAKENLHDSVNVLMLLLFLLLVVVLPYQEGIVDFDKGELKEVYQVKREASKIYIRTDVNFFVKKFGEKRGEEIAKEHLAEYVMKLFFDKFPVKEKEIDFGMVDPEDENIMWIKNSKDGFVEILLNNISERNLVKIDRKAMRKSMNEYFKEGNAYRKKQS